MSEDKSTGVERELLRDAVVVAAGFCLALGLYEIYAPLMWISIGAVALAWAVFIP